MNLIRLVLNKCQWQAVLKKVGNLTIYNHKKRKSFLSQVQLSYEQSTTTTVILNLASSFSEFTVVNGLVK